MIENEGLSISKCYEGKIFFRDEVLKEIILFSFFSESDILDKKTI